jgi:hypothetical protein
MVTSFIYWSTDRPILSSLTVHGQYFIGLWLVAVHVHNKIEYAERTFMWINSIHLSMLYLSKEIVAYEHTEMSSIDLMVIVLVHSVYV